MKPQRGLAGGRPVEAAQYTEEYFLTSCEGHEVFRTSGGERLSPRLAHALDLAAIATGDRVLDVACGRGEVVVHAARRGAHAVGIDYAAAATTLAQRALTVAQHSPGRAAVAQMDATCLGFPDATFDVVFMLDFVEHVHPPELARALDEAWRVLKPYGRLVIHTWPNLLYERVAHARYIRHVHRAVLAVAERLGYQDRLINRFMLPVGPTLSRTEYERRFHVNEQEPDVLVEALRRHGFQSIMVSFWEPPRRRLFGHWRLDLEVYLLDCVRLLRPLNRFWPLNRYFSNHIWVTAQRPA